MFRAWSSRDSSGSGSGTWGATVACRCWIRHVPHRGSFSSALLGARPHQDKRHAWLLLLLLVSAYGTVQMPALADRLRFQLPAQVWLAAFAGMGLAQLRGAQLAAFAFGVSLTWLPARNPYPSFAWQQEYAAAKTACELLPEDGPRRLRQHPRSQRALRSLDEHPLPRHLGIRRSRCLALDWTRGPSARKPLRRARVLGAGDPVHTQSGAACLTTDHGPINL